MPLRRFKHRKFEDEQKNLTNCVKVLTLEYKEHFDTVRDEIYEIKNIDR